jgi:hypothetical protein
MITRYKRKSFISRVDFAEYSAATILVCLAVLAVYAVGEILVRVIK